MITYYDDRSVQVTSTAVRVDGRSYPLAELTTVWHRRGDRSWRVLAGRGAIGAALAGPLVTAVLGIGLAVWLQRSAVVTIAIVGISVLIGLAVGPVADFLFEYLDRSYARGSREMEMWADWRGRPVRLLHTRDAMRFGQIYRAVQRAMESLPAAPRRTPRGPAAPGSAAPGPAAPGQNVTGSSGSRPSPRSRP
ncbi:MULTISPECIES: DUF6232 family protein [unclassified Micromonospora]|uniref:DUF6232 family protein n=1 Tax=unclassified Micromonospora TaxID=2617518 RepID=UPI001B39883A|nr:MULTISPECIES: DUF6232 family protein [unclassified Micromonospora]MBQ1045943.1 hypothetical protein [Micromonospora sp. C72]MBQ1057644.1 hypothetical protein [Micromonospora sp. C32]